MRRDYLPPSCCCKTGWQDWWRRKQEDGRWEPLHTNRSIGLAAGRDDSTLWICRRRWVCEVGVKEIWSLATSMPRPASGTRRCRCCCSNTSVRRVPLHSREHRVPVESGYRSESVAAQAVLIEQIRGSVLIDGQDEIAAVGLLGSSCTKPELTSRSFS